MQPKFKESDAFQVVRAQLSGLARLEAYDVGDPVTVVEAALLIIAGYKKAAVRYLIGKPFSQEYLPEVMVDRGWLASWLSAQNGVVTSDVLARGIAAMPRVKRTSQRVMTKADAIKVIDAKIMRAYEEEVEAWKQHISPYDTREPGSIEFGISPAEEMHRNFCEIPEGEFYEPSEDEYARFQGGLSEEFSDDEIVHVSESSIVGEVTPMERPDNKWADVYAKEHELFDALRVAQGAEAKGLVLRRAYTLAFPKRDSGKYGLIRPKYYYFLKTFAEAQLNAR